MLCKELRPGKDVGGLERRSVVGGGKLPSVFYSKFVRQVTHDASLVLFCSRSLNGRLLFFVVEGLPLLAKFDIHICFQGVWLRTIQSFVRFAIR